MQADYIIVGAGIAGTLLSFELLAQNRSVIVIDDTTQPKASAVAGAVINPINVSKWHLATHDADAIQNAVSTYQALQHLLETPVIEETTLLVFHKNAADRFAFEKERSTFSSYTTAPGENELQLADHYFNHEAGFAKINSVWRINAIALLSAWKKYLLAKNLFVEEYFDITQADISPERIRYKNIHASKIIFCEGAAAINNPFFKTASFTKNRGEALLLSIPHLPSTHIYQKQVRLVPSGDGLFWCGSNYTWQFDNLEPNMDWQVSTAGLLQEWLKIPFDIVDHVVAERPTTAGQTLLSYIHPQMPSVAILNGLGTKGYSMAPVLAKQLAMEVTSAG